MNVTISILVYNLMPYLFLYMVILINVSNEHGFQKTHNKEMKNRINQELTKILNNWMW